MAVSWSAPRGPEESLVHYLLQFLAAPSAVALEEGEWQNVTVPGSALSARLLHLSPATRYRIRVLAVNDLGPGPASEEVAASTMQEGEFH